MLKNVYFIVLIVSIEFFIIVLTSNHCEIMIKHSKHNPMFLERFGESYRFMSIKNQTISIRSGKSVFVTCQNRRLNLWKRKNSNEQLNNVKLFCHHNSGLNKTNLYFKVNGKQIDYNSKKHQFICKKNIIEFYQYNVTGCYHTGILVGYVNTIGENSPELIKLIEYCYDEKNMKTIFGNCIVASRTSFMEEQILYNTGDWQRNIKRNKLEPKVLELFASNLDYVFLTNFNTVEEDTSIGFTKAEIVSSSFFPFQYQMACNEYFNYALQWTGLKNGNWKILHDDIRNIANQEQAVIYTGTSGHLQLRNSNGELRKLFANNEEMIKSTIPIPTYFWTYVRTDDISFHGDNDEIINSFTSVVIVSINNPYLKLIELEENILCTDVCDDVQWLFKLRKTKDIITMGFTYCCSVNEAIEFIPEIPRHLEEKPKTKSSNYEEHSNQELNENLELELETEPINESIHEAGTKIELKDENTEENET